MQLMATILSRYEGQVVEWQSDVEQNIALGRLGIGVFNREAQPTWNESQSVAICLAGELYVCEGVEMADASPLADEQRLLALYAKHGSEFPCHIQGAYVAVIWDANLRQIVIANDHFALYPTYYACQNERLVFAPEVKGVLADPDVDRTLRSDAIAEFVRFQHLLGFKTFVAGVNLLPPASVLIYDLNSATHQVKQYWDLSRAPQTPRSLDFREALDEATRLFRQSMARRTRGPERLGVFLSGGLDGRSILGLIPAARQPVHTFTFGQRGCRDEVYAQQIAAAAGARHHYYPYADGRWILEWVSRHLELTEGFHPWIHMHGIQVSSDARQFVDVNLSGLGDLLWTQSNFAPKALVEAPDEIAFNAILFELYSQRYTWPGLTYAEARGLYSDGIKWRANDLAYESFMAELSKYRHLPRHLRLTAFNHVNHFLRYILHSAVIARPSIEVRFPYFDLELFAFCYGLTYEVGADRALQRALIRREMPALAGVAATDDELPLTSKRGAHMAARVTRKLRRGVHKLIAPLFPEHDTLYADYENWLRTDLRAWAERVLFDERTLARGFFRPEALRSLMDRHLAGHEYHTLGKIAHLITLELGLRQLEDQEVVREH
jgi:asparagine synthase (glutamine-hydrolysing)